MSADFVGAQFLARGFAGAESSTAFVILAEEVDAAVRGWAIGMLDALVSTGYGLAAMVFAAIKSRSVWMARALYARADAAGSADPAAADTAGKPAV